MNNWRRTAGFLFLSCILTLLAACGNGSSHLTKIRLFEVTHSIFYTPQYVALEKGFFEDEGLDVQLTNANGGDKAMTALLSGNAEVILMGAEATIYVKNQDAIDLAVNFAQLTQTDGSFLVSREPIENFSWNMLKGKTMIGQRKGGMPQMVSEYVQKENGVTPFQDVKVIQNIDFANLGTAFASGTGDFAHLFEPVASKLEQEGIGHVVASFGEESGKLPYTVFITKQSYIDQHPETVQKFTNAVYRAQQWVAAHSTEEIAEVISPQFPDLDRETLIIVLERFKSQDSFATDPILHVEQFENLAKIMEDAGELKQKVDFGPIINTDFARNAVQE
ncbi:hypothetical protein BEP19_05410 [Ammoniphilus oxalaticus]|uniref:SsuA/THI5-like domain-containing protein n=1 Tax=Ammoniphilus oxalaticus TaxID=66863 RepID=A0A419SIS8_9BACL|nr:ABC transporter substrate-binding protein [Ammoniphilus oxalaticus]RKD23867.1 hypothetical protein BEP19_05410 [Ammoniphilus oxalaticus]